MALGVGVSLNNSKAVLEAIWSSIRRKPSEFVRTPKYGTTGMQRGAAVRREGVLSLNRLALPISEVAFGLYMTACIVISLCGEFGRASIPFLVTFAGGYFYVGFSSLHVL